MYCAVVQCLYKCTVLLCSATFWLLKLSRNAKTVQYFLTLAKSLMLLFFWDFTTILASNKLLMGNTVMYCAMFFVLLFNKIFDVAVFGFLNNFSLK